MRPYHATHHINIAEHDNQLDTGRVSWKSPWPLLRRFVKIWQSWVNKFICINCYSRMAWCIHSIPIDHLYNGFLLSICLTEFGLLVLISVSYLPSLTASCMRHKNFFGLELRFFFLGHRIFHSQS